MPITATLTVAAPPANFCPTGPYLPASVGYINQNSTITVEDDSTTSFTYYRQSATPLPVANGIWDRIGADGFLNEPLGRYVYFNGRWTPEEYHRVGDLMMTNFDPNGYINSDGLGLFIPVSPSVDSPNITGPLFGWCLANGNHGTVNLQNRYPRAGYKYTEGTGWVANTLQSDGTYADISNGGREGITLTADEFPPIPSRTYSATATASTAALLQGLNYDSTVLPPPVNVAGVAQKVIQPINPLYRTVGIFSWVGLYTASQG